MRSWQVYYKGYSHLAVASSPAEAIKLLSAIYPELRDLGKYRVTLTGNKVNVRPISADLGEVYRKTITDQLGDLQFDVEMEVDLLLDEMAYKFNHNLIKQQIDRALQAGNFELCKILANQLKQYEDIPTKKETVK